MGDDALGRIDARLAAAPQGASVADRINQRIGSPITEEPVTTGPATRVFQTALTGQQPGTVAAYQRVVPSPDPTADPFIATSEAMVRSWLPDMLGGRTKPTLEQIKTAAIKDPAIGKVYYEEWLNSQRAKNLAQSIGEHPPAQTGNESIFARAAPPGGGDLFSPIQSATPAANDVGNEVNKSRLREYAGNDALQKRVFDRLTGEEAQVEQKYHEEHPWLAATAEIPGETVRMLPAIGAAMATGGAGLIPSALAFDAVSQAQRIHAGGQSTWSPEQSIVNMLSMLSGSGAATLAEKMGAGKAAQLIASNTGMLATPTALEAVSTKTQKKDINWGEFARQLYKGVAEAGFLSAAHLSAVPQRGGEAALAKEMAAEHSGGGRALNDTVAALEARIKEGQPPPAPEVIPPPPSEADVNTVLKAAKDAILRADQPPETLRKSRDQRRAALEAGMHPDAPGGDAALYDAMKALERDMRSEPPGSAKRLYYGSEEYALRLSEQFGIVDEASRKMLHELGSDLIAEPHRRSEREGGFARIGMTPEERARANEEQRAITQEHQRAIAGGYSKIRELTNSFVKRLIRMTGHEPSESVFLARTDRGIEQASARSEVGVKNLRLELRQVERQHHELMRATPFPNTVNRILTLASMVGPEEGASIATKTLPPELREPVAKFLAEYQAIAMKSGKKGAETGVIAEARWAVPYYDEAGKPQIREVVTKPGEPAPQGGNAAGLASPWLIGGRKFYEGHYVHQSYEGKSEPRGFNRKRELNAHSAISGTTPSSAFRRTKTAEEFVEQGILKMEPTFAQLSKQGAAIKQRETLNYLRDERPDLYLKKADFEGNVEQTYLKQIEQAGDRIKEIDKLVKAHTKQMAKDGLGIYAGEAGELTKAMAANRGRISRDLHAHMKEMSARQIQINGMPEGFDPNAKGNYRRASEIKRAQARYDLLSKQLWTHLQVERPSDELFGVKQMFRPGEVEANLKLRQLYDERIALRNIATRSWIPLKDTPSVHYDEHAGNYIRADALRDISFGNEAQQNEMSLADAFDALFKWSRVPGNPARSFTVQMLGNILQNSFGGTHFTIKGIGHWITSARHVMQFLWSEGRSAPSDPWFHELVDSARTSGPLAMYDAPTFAKERVNKALDAAHEAWINSDPMNAIRLLTVAMVRAAPYYAGKIPIFGKATRLTTAMDLIPQYAMYRQLRSGDGSTLGALNAEEALTHTGYFYDLGDIPRWLDRVIKTPYLRRILPTFARFLYKSPTAIAKWMMASPPTVGTYFLPGLRLPQPFERTILENAGTEAATKAIWANKAINLTLNMTKLVTHLAASEYLMAKRLGIDWNSEEYKKRKLAAAHGSSFHAFFLRPLDIKPDGTIKFWDFFNLFPGTNVASLGNMPDDLGGQGFVSRAAHFILSMNWMTNLADHLVNQTDSSGRPITMTRSLINAASAFLPGGFEMPAKAIYQSMQPWATKSPGEALLQSLTGINLINAEPGAETSQDLRNLAEQGHIKQVPMWQPLDPEGKMGLKLYERNPYNRIRAIKRALERMNQK